PPNCKPGLGAQVEILMDRRHQVVVVPLTSLYSQGPQTFVFVREEGRAYPRHVEVRVGATNDTHAEIVSGLAAGQDVLLLQPGQGRMLLEKANVKTLPSTRPGDLPNRPNRRRPNANAIAQPAAPADSKQTTSERAAKPSRPRVSADVSPVPAN